MMDYVKLGKTDLKVSVACLGCGGSSALGVTLGKSENESVNIVKEALNLGVNFIDTANIYGTEKIVGKAITNLNRDEIVISTKHQVTTNKKKYSLSEVINGLNNSLKYMDIDYIDVFHLHGVSPRDFDYAMSLVPGLLKEKKKGKFRYLGITESAPVDPEQITISKAIDTDVFDVVMLAFSIMNQNAKKQILQQTSKKNIGTMSMFVVRSLFSVPGRLKDEITKLVNDQKLPKWLLDETEPLEFLLKNNGAKNIIDACYRYARHQKGIDCVLFGTSSIEHLKNNIKSILSPQLSLATVKNIDQYFNHLKGVGLDFPEKILK